MSFKKTEPSLIAKRFVSETELAEIKEKRAEEWENARKQGRDIEKEEEEVAFDGRTLFDKLKEQKDKKQEDFEDQLKFKNMIYKGLDEEDATFLSDVSEKRAEIHNRRFDEESADLMSYRAAVEKIPEETAKNSMPVAAPLPKNSKVSSKSQSFLSNVIIRKRSKTTEKEERQDTKRLKTKDAEDDVVKTEFNKSDKIDISASTAPSLAGLIAYSDTDSSDTDS